MDNVAPKEPQAIAPLDLTGKTLGDYRVLRRLGQGGMGQVYLAEQISLRRKVALKVLRAEMAADPKYLQRFRTEAEAVAQATHANIVQVYAIHEVDGLHFMALEYVEGRNLREYLMRKGPPELPVVLSIMRQVGSALQRAAELGIVHRDIKPENILLTRKGEAKVADFGLARVQTDQPLNLTQSGVAMGTPLYMSPEQVRADPVDARSDMYSFGVTCYHMLAGHPPFKGENAFQVSIQHVNDEPEPLASIRPDVPVELCGIVHKMMAKKPEDRYQTPSEFLKDLARLRAGLNTATGLDPVRAAVLAMPTSIGSVAEPAAKTITFAMPRWSRWTWLALLSMPLWFLLGLAVAFWFFYIHRPKVHSVTSAEATANVDSDRELEKDRAILTETDARLEQFYRDGVDKPRDLDEAMRNGCKLAVFYLERGRLQDADSFFSKLLNDHPPVDPQGELQFLGKLGKAMVLAFQDDFKAAQNSFSALLAAPANPDRLETLLRKHPRFAEMFALALERQRQNLGVKELPEALEKYRKGKKP